MDHYRHFSGELRRNLTGIELGKNLKGDLQKLFALEEDFRATLAKYKKGIAVYSAFFDHTIKEDVRLAKIYFRERDTFGFHTLSKIIKDRDAVGLSAYRINYKFIKWSLGQDLPEAKRLRRVYEDIVTVRKKIVEENLPLVVNKARIYQLKSRDARLEFMDFVQIAADGMMHAVDKFVPTDTNEGGFLGVAIAWMFNKMSGASAEGQLKLTTRDKYILYRARIAIYRLNIEDPVKLLAYVRETFPDCTQERLQLIVESSKTFASIESDKSGYSQRTSKDNPEDDAITSDLVGKMRGIVDEMPDQIERKYLILKGGIR